VESAASADAGKTTAPAFSLPAQAAPGIAKAKQALLGATSSHAAAGASHSQVFAEDLNDLLDGLLSL
jgi:hypothetical protein